MENPIKMDDLGVPLFLETPIWCGPLATTFLDTYFHTLNCLLEGDRLKYLQFFEKNL